MLPPAYRRLARLCRFMLLSVVALTVVWTATDRFAPPVRERYVQFFAPGAADLYVPWAAARALLDGKDPYLTPLHDPWNRQEVVNGRTLYLLYPPAIITLYIPLAYFTDDFIRAGDIARDWHFLALIALAACSWWLIRSIRRSLASQDTEPVLLLVLFFCLTLCPQTSFALERAQSDLTVALLCWAAALLILHRHAFSAIFLVTTATLAKGYPALFGLGLGLFAILTGSAWRACAGALTASAALLLPVRNYLQTGFEAARFRSNMTCYEWRNYAFSQFIHQRLSDSDVAQHWGRIGLAGLCGVLAMLCWLYAVRSEPRDRPRWLVLFCLLSLTALVGYSSCGYMYSFVLIAPGLLIFLACAPELFLALGMSRRAALGFAALSALPAYCMFIVRHEDRTISLAADGLVMFVLINAAALLFGSLRALLEARQRRASEV